MNNKENMPKQGIDGCTFTIISKSLFNPMRPISLKSPSGNEFGTLKAVGMDYKLFICPAKYVRDTNEIPFGVDDFGYLVSMREEIKNVLRKAFPRGYYSEATKIEVNMTDTMVGKCRCKDLFGLLSDSMLHTRKQNTLYVTKPLEPVLDMEIPGFVSRTVGNQWKLKCYDKKMQLDVELGIKIEDPVVRIEFIMLSRKIDKMFGKKNDVSSIFSYSGMETLINEYKLLMDNLIDNYVKKHLSILKKQLLEDLRRYGSPTDVYCARKEFIHDKIVLQRALKEWYEEQRKPDNSKQVIYGLNKKYGLPSNVLDTLGKFHKQC